MPRRDFIRNTSLAAAGVTIINFPIRGKAAPSNKVIVAVMGVNSRGAYLAKSFSQLPGVEVAYICDVEEGAIKNGLAALKDASRQPAGVVRGIRKLVEQKDVDALVIAAPDHWHAPAAILGVAHGKHVYVEKPCGQNPYEGELLATALHKYQRHIQMGSQRRSFPSLIDAARQIKEGVIGNPILARPGMPTSESPSAMGKKCQCRPRWILIYGRGRLHAATTRTIWFIITGIGSGIGAPARPVITGRMRSTVAGGSWD